MNKTSGEAVTGTSFIPPSSRLKAWETVANLTVATTYNGVSDLVKGYCHAFGFHNFGFALRGRGVANTSDEFVSLLDFPIEWAQRYKALSHSTAYSEDPVIQHVTQAVIPTTWDCRGEVTFTERNIARKARGLLGAAGEHRLRAGLTIPLFSTNAAWSFLVLTTQDDSQAKDLLPELPWACLIAQSVMLAVGNLSPRRRVVAQTLTRRESEVLQWCAAGKTSWEISKILTVSEATVNFHLSNIARKLGTRGRHATCAQAIALALIRL